MGNRDRLKTGRFTQGVKLVACALTDELKITILHAGPGALWTDLEKAKLGKLGGATLLMEPAKPAK